jgi:hypothetical protein
VNEQVQVQKRRFERILFLIFLLTLPFVNPWVRGDGVGYYAYIRAPLIQHNLDFTRDYQYANEGFREVRCDANGQPKPEYRTRTGHLDNHFSVGPAMLWSPFLLVAHTGVLSARALGSKLPADGFSDPYRYAMAVSTCLYGFLGLWFSFRLALRYVATPVWPFLATLVIWGGSSLLVYMYFNPSWSHALSAFIVAAFLFYWDATREHRIVRQWVLLGIVAGLMLNVYYLNLMVLSVLIVEAGPQYAALIRRSQFSSSQLFSLLGRHLLFGTVVCAVMIPTFVSRYIVYGGPLSSGYVSIRDYLWRDPVFWNVLFSSNHGLLAWTPVLALAIIGIILFAIRAPRTGTPFLVALVVFYLFLSFYPDWAGIASFGNRFFVSLTPIFVLGLAYLLEQLAMRFRKQRTAVIVSSGILTCFIVWNLGLVYQWGTHLVPARGPISFRQATYNQFCIVPFELTSRLRMYVFRRGELMKQIEKKDIDQQMQQTNP